MSDTDSDEFYDAQDVTPSRSSTLPSRSETQGSNEDVTSLSTIEMEKQELLEQKQSIEERLRQEEEEIQKKLLALELKQVKDQEKQEAAKKMLENKQRRKKLEDIRQMMSRDRSPVATTKTSTTEHEDKLPHGAATKTDVESSALTAEQQLEEKLEALSFELERSRQCAAMQDSSGSDLSMDSSHYVTASKMKFEDYSLGYMLDGSSIGSSGYSANVSRYSQKSSSLNGNLDKHSCSIQKVTCKHIQNLVAPEPVQPKYSSLPIQLSTYPCKECREVTQIYQEPDIIQSTKSLPWQQPSTSTPKTEVVGDVKSKLHDLTLENSQTPVAPPRKKRSFRSSESLRCDAEIRKSEGSDSSDHLSTECLPSLDLSTAIQGNFHVTATDDVAAKGLEVVDVNEPDDNGVPADAISQGAGSTQSEDNMDVPTQTQEKDPDIQTSVSSNSDLHLARVKSKTLGGSTPHMSPAKPAAAKVLTDKEILEQVMVTNLDTGEKLPLSLAEEKVPTTTNPLALHIMKRTKEYSSESPMQKGKDGASKGAKEHGKTVKKISLPKKQRKKIKKFLSKSVRKIKSELKSVKDDVFHTENSSSDEDEFIDERRMIRIKASHSHKGPYDFDLLVPVQNLEEDSNAAVWTMKFSHCGKLLATGGQDNLLRLWVLKSYYSYFTQMRQRYSEAANPDKTQADQWRTDQEESVPGSGLSEDEDQHAPFMNKPFCVYKGHTADLLDLSWSKNYFILSSSMDKTVRLWHVSRSECLCCFQHIDFVTAIAFHPKDDRYFLSGSLDGKLRLWSIPEKKVALWNEVSGQSKLITSANFCSDGKIAVGTYDGRCILYTADHLDYHTQIHVRSTRGKNAKGGKVTGVEPYPGENKILVTSNDSRIRLYDLRDKTLTCKYKGTINSSSRIKAVFNHDGRYIICGSEDGCVYIWKTQHDFYKFYSVRRDRNDFWEGVKAHVAVVTAAIFAPCPDLIIHPQFEYMDSDDKQTPGVRGEVIISADINGAIKVFINKFKPGSG